MTGRRQRGFKILVHSIWIVACSRYAQQVGGYTEILHGFGHDNEAACAAKLSYKEAELEDYVVSDCLVFRLPYGRNIIGREYKDPRVAMLQGTGQALEGVLRQLKNVLVPHGALALVIEVFLYSVCYRERL